jgi:hypothetical protein
MEPSMAAEPSGGTEPLSSGAPGVVSEGGATVEVPLVGTTTVEERVTTGVL